MGGDVPGSSSEGDVPDRGGHSVIAAPADADAGVDAGLDVAPHPTPSAEDEDMKAVKSGMKL